MHRGTADAVMPREIKSRPVHICVIRRRADSTNTGEKAWPIADYEQTRRVHKPIIPRKSHAAFRVAELRLAFLSKERSERTERRRNTETRKNGMKRDEGERKGKGI